MQGHHARPAQFLPPAALVLVLLPLPGCGNATDRTAADRVPGRGFFSYDGGVC